MKSLPNNHVEVKGIPVIVILMNIDLANRKTTKETNESKSN